MAVEIGVPVSEFWDITPHELNLKINAYGKRHKEQNDALLIQAFLISRWVWAKRVNIKKFITEEKPKGPMTDKQMLEQVKKLNELLGGEVK